MQYNHFPPIKASSATARNAAETSALSESCLALAAC